MKSLFHLLAMIFVLTSCSGENDNAMMAVQQPISPILPEEPGVYKYLALGDSYTIGQSVCTTCRFPEQLKSQIESSVPDKTVALDIIATTGWTTTNLLSAIQTQNPAINYDLVTLLIGVNNQYQHKPFSLYQQEFPDLLNKAIQFAKGDVTRVIVVSIPDYAYTPFGQGTGNMATISAEIDQYNLYAQGICESRSIEFVNITDITRLGIEQPSLVASDGLHPSEAAYTQFVTRIFPKALVAIE